jgi:hypothetical protein
MGAEHMLHEHIHLTNEELLLAADGELNSRRATQARAHLAACWDCRARMAEIEDTIADFARAYHQTVGTELPPIEGPRALLRARLAELREEARVSPFQRLFQISWPTRAVVYVYLAFLVVAVAGRFLVGHPGLRGEDSSVVAMERGELPDRHLTPGATRTVSIREVCSSRHEEVVRAVPTSVRQEIFQEYGIVTVRADDYEIDYLIAPRLGGTEDVHNLWPESYTSPMWNARVKDALEEHLHELVCAGKVDLATAQRDIATDWIAAYKKYFHTDRPLEVNSDLISNRRPAIRPVDNRWR